MAIESPVDVLRRLREQAKAQRLARAERSKQTIEGAKTPQERSRAVGSAFGEALYQRFNQPELEQDPAVLQAKRRQQWLNIDPGNEDQIKANIKASAEAGDYEVSNYLTGLYYKNREAKAAELRAANTGKTTDKPYSREDKLLTDADKAERAGDFKRAELLRRQAKNIVAEKESKAAGTQMEQFDQELSQSFGVSLEDITSGDWQSNVPFFGTVDEKPIAFQYMRDSARDRSELYGDSIGKTRRDIEKYITYDTEYRDEFLPSTQFKKEYEKGKTDYMFKDGQVYMGHVNDKGGFKMITRIPLSMVHDEETRSQFEKLMGE